MYPSIGNHDIDFTGGGPYLAEFVLPENGPEGVRPERHYWFDWGDVRFVCLDSNDSFMHISENVAPWLDGVLESAGGKWTILFFHHPLYTNGSQQPSGRLRSQILPVIDKHRADVVLAGHNHLYERSKPIFEGNVVGPGEGTVYVTTGGGGGGLQKSKGPKPDFLVMQDDTQHSYTYCEVSPTKLAFQQISIEGEVMDEFVIERSAPTAVVGEPL
jgi:hypothetical protein